MGARWSFLVLCLCLFLSDFQVYCFRGDASEVAFSPAVAPLKAAMGTYASRRSPLVSNLLSEPPSQHTAKSWTNPHSISPEKSLSEHHHGKYHHRHDHHQHAKLPHEKAAPGPSSLHPPLPSARHGNIPFHPPDISPSSYTVELTHPPTATPHALPPPPPNQDCTSVACPPQWTSTLSGTPCGCVLPIQVRLQINVVLYAFLPLVSKLASEIAESLSLEQNQVRIMGANAASQEPEKTDALIYLVPLSEKFKHDIPSLAYQKFWRKQVHLNFSLFGAYDVLGVNYPGLPPSPPSVSSNLAAIDNHNHPFPANFKEHGDSSLKPLGVEVPKRPKNGVGGRVATVIIVSSLTVFVTFAAIIWIFIASCRSKREAALHTATSSFSKPSGGAKSLALGNRTLSESLSFSSGVLNITGYARIYTLQDIEKATRAFDTTRVLGEGGFGVVYRGVFDDGEQVAVKVLKKNNHRGAQEFLSEVEMLSRLHHRNLVKLLGICTEEHIRCLVYELVPNGSVEYHLHGVDKEATLDWPTRMKIALGAARGLAYLHEDSSPCVIHRDFKSSNILLEHDFMPKVSDFGLATNAMNGENQVISTQVLGTFGYVAPEYAMTGQLLVKSDVYSYGVVLLELLTGRKPVDFSKPPGQENLVTWAQPFLTSKDGLELLMDPNLKPILSFDSFSKVAAIASMCVQPEASRRPFMGEVVQALKLVCSELDNPKEDGPRSSSSNHVKVSEGEFQEFFGANYPVYEYESCSDAKIASSAQLEGIEDESSRRRSRSGPLGKKKPFWQRLGRFSGGSMRERLWPGSH